MQTYKTNGNQKHITVIKEPVGKDNTYCIINLETMEAAAQDLGAGAFKLWIYLAKNQNNYKFDLSSAHANSSFGLKLKQYNNAVHELIEKGYLVQVGDLNYEFHEKGAYAQRA